MFLALKLSERRMKSHVPACKRRPCYGCSRILSELTRGAGSTGAAGAAAPPALGKITEFFYFPIVVPLNCCVCPPPPCIASGALGTNCSRPLRGLSLYLCIFGAKIERTSTEINRTRKKHQLNRVLGYGRGNDGSLC